MIVNVLVLVMVMMLTKKNAFDSVDQAYTTLGAPESFLWPGGNWLNRVQAPGKLSLRFVCEKS
jgi:hypothetical protein